MSIEYTQENSNEITQLLLGRKVTKIGDNALELDNGTILEFEGSHECCQYYELTELNGIENIITKVELLNDPDDPFDYPEREGEGGTYRIFVYAENQKVNLAVFDGTDGNGYYGTGYTIYVTPKKEGDTK